MKQSKQMKDAAKLVAGCMMSHFEGGIEEFKEFFPTDEGEIDGLSEDEIKKAGDWVDENIHDMYDDDSLEFRKAVLKQLKTNLEIK